MKLLFIADIMGRPGRQAIRELMPPFVDRHGIQTVVANGENAAGGSGFTGKIANELFDLGIDLLTGGNHSFDNRDGVGWLNDTDKSSVIRPLNFPPGAPGKGTATVPLEDGGELLVLNLQGRVFMLPIDCPFRAADEVLREWGERGPVLVDIHAEASSEKIALAHHLDGRVTAVIGTHTHVQTADSRLLPGGTATLTDAGMTGSHAGVIGIEKEIVVDRFLHQTMKRFQLSKGAVRLQGAMVEFDPATGRALSIENVDLPLEQKETS
jgi:2',3'-cyclic-nucleotide 2'-phosphodiesterase